MQAQSESRGKGRGGKIAVGIFVGVLAVLLAIYLADLAMNRGNVPRGTTVGGVAIGGMKPESANEKLQDELGNIETNSVSVRADQATAQFVPAQAGLVMDWDATIDAVGVESANPISRLRGLFTQREVDAVASVDEAKFNPAMETLSAELHRDPVDGAIHIEGGRAKVDGPVLGQDVGVDKLSEAIKAQWLLPEGVEVEPVTVEPAVNEAAVTAAEQGPVRAALNGPLTVRSNDPAVAATVPQERLGEIIQFPVVEGKIQPQVNVEAAQEILSEQLAPTEVESQNARVLTGGGVQESVDGLVVDWEQTLDGFEGRLLNNDPREWDATYKAQPATFTTEDAANATFDQVVGSFTTSGYSAASGQNIALVAQTVSGAVVNPGETFSLNGYTGPRGTAQGYVESGIILNGRADTAVGGGISQFATTLYNAAYFAAMTDVAHTPHSYYISRYPAGREATVYEGAIDLQFRNDTPHPVKIVTSVGGGSVTVSLMGVKTSTVESFNGGRWAPTQPQEQRVTGSSCIPSSGAPGFTTSDTRVIYDLAGNELSRETQTTVYTPVPIVKCG